MSQLYLSVIIPAYNEAKRLPLTLINIDKLLFETDYSYEIIVINDGSKDATAEIVKRFNHLIKNLRLIDNKKNYGEGKAVRQGMLESKGQIRLLMDAGNSVSIDQFKNMIAYFKQDYAIVIGSRGVKGTKLINYSLLRRFFDNLGNYIIQILLVLKIRDMQCGFKAFTKEASEKIFSLSKIDGWGFDVEALALGKKLGYKIKEIPITWVGNNVSRLNLIAYLQVLGGVFKIKWGMIRNKYNLKLKNQNVK